MTVLQTGSTARSGIRRETPPAKAMESRQQQRGSCQISVEPTAPCFVGRASPAERRAGARGDAPVTRYAPERPRGNRDLLLLRHKQPEGQEFGGRVVCHSWRAWLTLKCSIP